MRDATIYDVAKRAGVSHQTVSRFLRGFEGMRPETREKVEQAVAELEYRPNSAARYLRLQRTNRIGLLADNMEQTGPGRMIVGATQTARAHGYVLDIVAIDGSDEASVFEAIDLVLSQQIAGIILTAQTDAARAAIERRPLPVPVSRDFGLVVEGTGATVNEHAGRVAADHLLGLGHRRIAYVAGPGRWVSSVERAQAFAGAVTAAGGDVTAREEGDWSAAAGFATGCRLASRVAEFTAVAVGNDAMAMGLLASLAAAGVRVPEDVSVIGTDDTPEARFMVPSLSTVAMDFASEGAHVAAALIAQIEGRDVSSAPRLHVPAVIPRMSSGPVRA